MLLRLALILVLALSISSCSSSKKNASDLNLNDSETAEEKTASKSSGLVGCWSDSREEDTDKIKTYRPCAYSFPPSRFRFKMDLKQDGSCSYMPLAANDKHQMKEGNWVYDQEANTLKIFSDGKELIKELHLIDVEESTMRVKI